MESGEHDYQGCLSNSGDALFITTAKDSEMPDCLDTEPLTRADDGSDPESVLHELFNPFRHTPYREPPTGFLTSTVNPVTKTETVGFTLEFSELSELAQEIAIGRMFNYLAGLDWVDIRAHVLSCIILEQPWLSSILDPECKSVSAKVKNEVRTRIVRGCGDNRALEDILAEWGPMAAMGCSMSSGALVDALERGDPLGWSCFALFLMNEFRMLKRSWLPNILPGNLNIDDLVSFCESIDGIIGVLDLLKDLALNETGRLSDVSLQEDAIRLYTGHRLSGFDKLKADPAVKAVWFALRNACELEKRFEEPGYRYMYFYRSMLPPSSLREVDSNSDSVKSVRAGVVNWLCKVYDKNDSKTLPLLASVTAYIAISESRIPLTDSESSAIAATPGLREQLEKDAFVIKREPTCAAMLDVLSFDPPIVRAFDSIADAVAVMAIDDQKVDPTLKLKVCKRCGRVFLGTNRAVYCDRPIEGSFGDDGERETCRSASAKERLRGKTVSGGSTLKHALNELSRGLSDKSKYVVDDVAKNVLSQSARGQVSAHVEDDTLQAYRSIEYWYMRRVINKFLYEQVAELGSYEAETCSAEITDWARSATSGPGKKEMRISIIEAYERAASKSANGWMAVSGMGIRVDGGSLSFFDLERKYETLERYAEANGAEDASSAEGVVLWFQERYGRAETDGFEDVYAFKSGIWVSWDYNLHPGEQEPFADIERGVDDRRGFIKDGLLSGDLRTKGSQGQFRFKKPAFREPDDTGAYSIYEVGSTGS